MKLQFPIGRYNRLAFQMRCGSVVIVDVKTYNVRFGDGDTVISTEWTGELHRKSSYSIKLIRSDRIEVFAVRQVWRWRGFLKS